MYKRHALPQEKAAVQTIRDWIAAGERVALTCFAHDAGQCHRRSLAEVVLEGLDGGVGVEDL